MADELFMLMDADTNETISKEEFVDFVDEMIASGSVTPKGSIKDAFMKWRLGQQADTVPFRGASPAPGPAPSPPISVTKSPKTRDVGHASKTSPRPRKPTASPAPPTPVAAKDEPLRTESVTSYLSTPPAKKPER
eukprot:TRINITY_DN4119_c0_g1_i1.p1 TRINITY_DN4119_c0_g1~~TRINITY_DN4119_c0_g1_i1.p1  ORF type:complete len:135 (+),score=14.57 TRINITY_DN4119_c0_g1_i1:217-621(+)